MFSNNFLEGLRAVDFTLLRGAGLLPAVSRWVDAVANGTPLQRANTYTYRTADFLLASAQRYHPGMLNDQHHVWSATLSNKLSIFTAHPPVSSPGKKSPDDDANYWVGPGRLPDAAQQENVCLQIFRVPERPTLGEKGVNQFTHAYFPKEQFDRVDLRGPRAYGKHGDVYVALIGNGPLAYRAGSTDDLIQDGRDTAWVCELGSASRDGDFDSFVRRIECNTLAFHDSVLSYQTGTRRLELGYGRDFRVNGVAQDSNFARHDSPYARTARNPAGITLEFAGKRLVLDFAKGIRREE